MSDTSGTGAAPVDTGAGPGPVEQAQQPVPDSGGGNPAWEPIRSKLGPSFGLIEDHLKEWDRSAQQRVEQANTKAQRYEQLGDYDSLNRAYLLQQRLDANPMEVHSLLTNYLRETGMLPAEAAQVAQQMVEEDDDPQSDVERQLQALGQSQQQIQEFLAAQEYQREQASAEAEFGRQMQSIRQSNPHISDDDEQEIYGRALANAMRDGSDPDLAKATEEFNALRTRLLSTPRPGASAPRLVPSGGGAPTRGEPQNPAKMTPAQRQAYVTELLKAGQPG